MKKVLVIITFFMTFFGHAAISQDTLRLEDYYVDLSIPDNGISGLLQAEFSQVQSLNNLKDFALQIFNGGGDDESKGIGAEFSLDKLLVHRDRRTLENYQKNKFGFRSKRNLRPLIGLTNSDNGTNLAFGFNYNLINNADYYRDPGYVYNIQQRLQKGLTSSEIGTRTAKKASAISGVIDSISSELVLEFAEIYDSSKSEEIEEVKHNEFISKLKDAIDDRELRKELVLKIGGFRTYINDIIRGRRERNETLMKELKNAKDQYIKENWNAVFLTINTGVLLNSTDKKIENLKAKKWQFALAFGTPMGNKSQLLFTLRYSGNVDGRSLMDTEGTQMDEEQGSLFYGARLLTKLNKKEAPMTANIFLEAGNTRTTFFNRDFKEELRGVLGVEAKIFEGSWIQTGVAFHGGGATFQIDFKHAFVEKSRF